MNKSGSPPSPERAAFGQRRQKSPQWNAAIAAARASGDAVKNLRIAAGLIMPRIASVAAMANCVSICERMAEILTLRT